MKEAIVNLYSTKNGEISNFLNHFFGTNIALENPLKWEKTYSNPIEIADIVGSFIDNSEDYEIAMWISLDKGFFMHIHDSNADDFIRYLYERYPY